MRSTVLRTARPVAALLAVLLAAPALEARTIVCESRDNRYRYCPVQTYGDVSLRTEYSRWSCQYGRGWGYDHRGIWVDRGCRAVFAVDEGHRSHYGSYDYYDHRDHSSKGTAAVAGVALGAAVAAAIIASKHKQADEGRDDVPSWLVGRFEGFNTQYNTDVSIQVSPSGSVTAFLPEGQKSYGTYRNGLVVFSGEEFDVAKTGSGFTLTQRSDRNNVVAYHRDR